MTSPTTPTRSKGFIEPLEARIAPATILIGAKPPSFENHNDTEYVEKPFPDQDHPDGLREPQYAKLNFVDINNALATDKVAEGLRGTGLTALTGTDAVAGKFFYLHLHAGDNVVTYTPGSGYDTTNPFISVTGGDAIAVFTDFTTTNGGKNNYDDGEFTGLVLSAGAKVQVNGGVNGDIVAALDTHRTASYGDDSVDFVKLVSNKENISNLRILGGSVNGSVIAGGSIDNIVLNNSVENVLTGSAANGHKFDFVQTAAFPNGRFSTSLVPDAKTAGPNITNGTIREIIDRVEAGAGGFGGKGGSLTNITVTADTDGFALIAGRGGDANGAITTGGAGGGLTKINVQGTVDRSFNSAGSLTPILIQGSLQTYEGIKIVAGDGGGTFGASVAVRGGAGGGLTGLTVGAVGTTAAADLSADSVHVFGGKGGDGKTGGLGGSISTSAVIIGTKDGNGHEIDIVAGPGGKGGVAGQAGGAAGAGGGLTTVTASNTFSSLDPSVSTHALTSVKAGAAGLTVATSGATGGAGGSLKTVNILAFDSEIEAGSGSNGTSGGKGGSVTGVTFTTNQSVIPNNMTVNAGRGGDGDKLAGGAGGVINGVKSGTTDIQTLFINTKVGAGVGGKSNFAKGGAGGGVSAVDVTDADKSRANTFFLSGDVQIYGGAGGSGATGGGAGGAFMSVRVDGDHFSVNAAGGQGGNATVKGAGGAGGALNLTNFKGIGDLNVAAGADPHPSGVVQAGKGGDGAGTGAGGAGGSLTSVGLDNEGNQTLRAGAGGSGQNTVGAVKGGAAGKGGSVNASGVISHVGSGFLYAGDAGVNGATAGAGGSIMGVPSADAVNGVRALGTIVIRAGDGSHGGAGGDIGSVGFEGSISTLAPIFPILVQAGAGSSNGTLFGRGGNITNLTGVAAASVDTTGFGSPDTLISAGNGAGAGGSVSHLTISGGGADKSIIVVQAGNAGTGGAKSGAKGGSVIDVGVAGVVDGTLVRSIAAGDGAAGKAKGGAGGSVDQIFVPNGDIGYRTGQAFGYNSQGGIFAGQGGVSGTGTAAPGLNGSVSNVTAQSISSIVAGGRNSPIPHLAEKVFNVSVNGTNQQLLLGKNGIFVPDGDLVFTFMGQQTALVAAHSTAAEVQAALNALSSIHALGDVTVSYTLNGGYAISFNQPGNQAAIGAVEVVTRDVAASIPQKTSLVDAFNAAVGEVALPVAESPSGLDPFASAVLIPGSSNFFATETQIGNSVRDEIQTISLALLNGAPGSQFTLSFLGEVTSRLPYNATALDIEIALDNLTSIQNAGFVTVNPGTAPNTFTIEFGSFGRPPLIVGQTFVSQVERLDIHTITAVGVNKFKLTFNGETTANFLPANATASQIKNALNGLKTIKALEPIFSTGSVNVAPVLGSPGIFDITFTQIGLQQLVTGFANIQEVQKISVSGAAGNHFVVRAGDQATPQFVLGTSAEQVQVALNALQNIQKLGGVTVTQSGGDYLVKFNAIGDQVALTSSLLQKGAQSIDLSTTVASTTDSTFLTKYPLTVNEAQNGLTVPLPVTDGSPAYFELNDSGRINGSVIVGSPTVPSQQSIIVGSTASGAPALKDGDLFILEYSDSTQATAINNNTVVIRFQTDLTKLAAVVQTALNALPALKGGVTVSNTAPGLLVKFVANGVQAPLRIQSETPTPHPGEFDNVTSVTDGDFANKEVQVIDLDNIVSRGGQFSFSFAGQQTPFAPSSNVDLTASITASLGALSAISDFGGVTVKETAQGSHLFTITFNNVGDTPTITATGRVPESEELNLTSLAADPTNEFTLTFKGQETPIIPQNASAKFVEDSLNRLTTIKNEGGVRVFKETSGTYVNQFRVDFNRLSTGTPDQPNITISSGGDVTHEIQHLDLRSLAAYTDGQFALNFTSGGTTETTVFLAYDATENDVANALNALGTIQDTRHEFVVTNPQATPPTGFINLTGQVAVTKTGTGEYDIKFNSFGPKQALDGFGVVDADRYPITVTQTTHGAPGIVSISETKSGAAKSQSTVETTKGTAAVSEHQKIDLSSFNGAGPADFTLTFGTDTTTPIAFTGNGVAPDASAVAQALNNLPSIRALNGNANAVTVTGANGVYDIAFIPNGDEVPIIVNARQVEVQQLDLGNVYAAPKGEFTLSFGSQKTAALGPDAQGNPVTAQQIEDALNNLGSVTTAGLVDVVQSSNPATPERFSVTFRQLGDQPAIAAEAGLSQSVQRIALGDLFGRTDTDFKLTFNGQMTPVLDANLSPAALAAEIGTALNNLNSIKDTRTAAINPQVPTTIGHVTVVPDPVGVGNFVVTFDARGDVPTIDGFSVGTQDRIVPTGLVTQGTAVTATVTSVNGSPSTKEKQTIDLSALTAVGGAAPEFQLQFDNNLSDTIGSYTTPILQMGNTPVQTADIIRLALNALPTIQAASGNVTVVPQGNGTSFDVTFNANGDQQPISGVVGHHETQRIDVAELTKFRLPVTTPVQGDANTQEQQVIDLTGVKTDFSLKFGTDRTPVLDAGTGVNVIQDALNNLPSVQATGPNGTGSVSVTAAPNNRIIVTFNELGNQQLVLGGNADISEGVLTLKLNQDVTRALQVGTLGTLDLSDLQEELNSLAMVQGQRGHQQGTVTVTVVNGAYQVDFNSVGDAFPLMATGTFAQTQSVDIHRLTDGAASSSVPLPITEATRGQLIGPSLTTVGDGATAAMEVQTIDLSQEISTSPSFKLNFGADTTGSINSSSNILASQIQDALNSLPSVQNLNGNGSGSVSVTQPSAGQFEVTFSVNGDQASIVALDDAAVVNIPVTETVKGQVPAQEIQKLDLAALSGTSLQVIFGSDSTNVSLLTDHTDTVGNATALQNALNSLPSVKATVSGNNGSVSVVSNNDTSLSSYGTFNITFSASADEAPIGATSFPSRVIQDGDGTISEVQRVDFSALQNVAGSYFRISYNGGTTTAIDHQASAITVQVALNNLPQFSSTGGVTVAGANGVFDITFNDTTDHAGLVAGSGGILEVQHVDTTTLTQAGAGQFTLSFGGQQVSLSAGASAGTVQNALNNLSSIANAGGVNVTATSGGNGATGYDITFRNFNDPALIVGNISVFEQQIIDLHQFPSDGGFIKFSANGVTSDYIPTDDGFFEQFDIQFAISQLGLGNVGVTETHPGVFLVSFSSAGSQPSIEGEYNSLGHSVRVPGGASQAELESAFDNASIPNVTLSTINGLGSYQVAFDSIGSQNISTDIVRTHEQLRVDPFAVGDFTITLFGDTTYKLPANADKDQIRLALNGLSSVKDLGGVREVKVNPDSSFSVTFLGDDSVAPVDFIPRQTLDLVVDSTDPDFQTVDYATQGTFSQAKFANARLVGAIADYNEIDSFRFHFIDLINNPTAHFVSRVYVPGAFVDGHFVEPHYIEQHYEDAAGHEVLPTAADATHPFLEGDLPIDGIVMAKTIDEKTTNFVPEARLTQDPKTKVNVFFDSLNR